jgi:hypothetical protein
LLHLGWNLGAVEVSLSDYVEHVAYTNKLIQRDDASEFPPACFCGAGTTELDKSGVCPNNDNKMYDPETYPDEQWNEWWLDIKTPSCLKAIQEIMSARIKIAKDKGCDAVDPDNMDGYANKVLHSDGEVVTPHGLTEEDQFNYLK